MILCLDLGNSHLSGGVFAKNKLQLEFRYPDALSINKDQLGSFLKTVLHKNNMDVSSIRQVAVSSVRPSLNAIVYEAIAQYFLLQAFFLDANNVPDLKIAYQNPQELGADRIATTIAALHLYPDNHLIVIDLGTATTVDAISRHKEFVGGLILPGLYISMKALCENTAKLSPVDIIKPDFVLGKTTATNIQSGLYYGHLGALKEIIRRISEDYFSNAAPIILGTGGFATLFQVENIFDVIMPNLVLEGLYLTVKEK